MIPGHLVPAAMACLFPLTPVLDFGGLPPAGAVPPYALTITLEAVSGAKLEMPMHMTRLADAQVVMDGVIASLEQDRGWVFQQNGLSVILLNRRGSPVRKVEMKSTGPKPMLRWLPKDKK